MLPNHSMRLSFVFGVSLLFSLVVSEDASSDLSRDRVDCHEDGAELEIALKACERLASAETSDMGAMARNWSSLAVHYKRAGRMEAALLSVDLAIRIQPDNADTRAFRGTLLLKLGRSEEAGTEFTKALELDPVNFGSLLGRGHIYSNSGLYDQALADFDSILAVYPNEELALLGRASVHLTNENYAAMLKDLDAAIKINPENGDTYFTRGIANLGLENLIRAEQDFEKAYALGVRTPGLLLAREKMKQLTK